MSADARLRIPLPHSKESPYTGNLWPILVKDLENLKNNPTAKHLETIILKHLNRNCGPRQTLQSLPNLRAVFSQQPALGIIPFVAESALSLPELFPEGSLPGLVRGEASEVRLSRTEVCCLLSHMLLCSVLVHEKLQGSHCGHFTGARAPTGPQTFCYWLYHQENSTGIYLNSLVTYFALIQTFSQEELEEKVTFRRFVCDHEERSWDPTSEAAGSKIMTEIRLHLEGRIGDLEQVEVDFANKHVGFGTTATQEELLLGTSPETCVVVLFNEVLDDNESLLITGARRYGDYSGYGRTAQYTGTFSQEWNWRDRKIIAIDAISHPGNQLGDVSMMRELRKAWLGFSSVGGERVSTGHWGCGAFGGDQNVKCVVQALAATMAGVTLDFYCFGDKQFFAAFQAAYRVMRGKSVRWVWDRIVQYRESKVRGKTYVMNFLKPGNVPLLTIFRHKRRDCHKLKKPEDKSSIILGKYKESKAFPKPGVSEKASPIHVKWERPVMIQTVNPEISGDVGGLNHFGLAEMDLSKPKLEFEKSSALKTASEDVKRVLSLEFARRRNVVDKLTQDVLKSIQRHPRDFSSLEVKITMQTIKIRNLQQHLYDLYPYKNQPVKHVLTHMVTSRRKNIGRLREQDYKKYEWLLEKLNLLYKPMPHDTPEGVLGEKENVARKASIEKLTDIWCSELRSHRLKAYERKLQEAQPDFLRKKAERLQFILEEERDLGLEPTVSQEEIDECREKADSIQLKLDSEVNQVEEFLIYKEEIKEQSLSFHSDSD